MLSRIGIHNDNVRLVGQAAVVVFGLISIQSCTEMNSGAKSDDGSQLKGINYFVKRSTSVATSVLVPIKTS